VNICTVSLLNPLSSNPAQCFYSIGSIETLSASIKQLRAQSAAAVGRLYSVQCVVLGLHDCRPVLPASRVSADATERALFHRHLTDDCIMVFSRNLKLGGLDKCLEGV